MRRIFAQTRIELIQLLRDRLSSMFILVMPVVLLILFGVAITLTVTHLPIIVQDFDDSSSSRAFADAFRASNTLYVVAWPTNRQPEEAFLSSDARAVIVIPAHFERDVLRRKTAPVQLLADGSDSNTASLIAGDVTAIVNAYNVSHAGRTAPQPVQAQIRLWYNPGLDSKKYSGPGVFVLCISMFAPMLASLAMAKESETNTILQAYSSNISALEFVLGKILAFTLVGLAESVPLLITLGVYFHVAFAAEPSAFLVATLLYAFCVAAFGVMVGAAIPKRAAALQAVTTGGFLLVFLISGLIFPVDNIPWQIRWMSNLVWGKHYISIVRDAFLAGGGWRTTWFDMAVIGFIGIVFTAIAWSTLRKMQVKA
jgi:ABC-2 type transport system permease protein